MKELAQGEALERSIEGLDSCRSSKNGANAPLMGSTAASGISTDLLAKVFGAAMDPTQHPSKALAEHLLNRCARESNGDKHPNKFVHPKGIDAHILDSGSRDIIQFDVGVGDTQPFRIAMNLDPEHEALEIDADLGLLDSRWPALSEEDKEMGMDTILDGIQGRIVFTHDIGRQQKFEVRDRVTFDKSGNEYLKYLCVDRGSNIQFAADGWQVVLAGTGLVASVHGPREKDGDVGIEMTVEGLVGKVEQHGPADDRPRLAGVRLENLTLSAGGSKITAHMRQGIFIAGRLTVSERPDGNEDLLWEPSEPGEITISYADKANSETLRWQPGQSLSLADMIPDQKLMRAFVAAVEGWVDGPAPSH